jgi:tRNA (mo5U34)-methyltransferase
MASDMGGPAPRLDDAALREAIARYTWFHSLTLRPGIVTAGTKPAGLLAEEEEAILGSIRLQGREVLDIGAWNGYFSFAAARRGAARVLATDSFTWRHRHYRGRETIELARRELGLPVELHDVDPTEIEPGLGRFDVVLFLGVFYHLENPMLVMRRVRAMTKGVLLIETHQDALDQPRPMMVFYPGRTLNNDPTNWWGPNLALMLTLLLELGFERVEYRNHPVMGAGRGIYAAFLPGAFERLAGDFGPPWISMTHKAG